MHSLDFAKNDGNTNVRDMLSESRKNIIRPKFSSTETCNQKVKFCGRQKLPLRGHRNCGCFRIDEHDHNEELH